MNYSLKKTHNLRNLIISPTLKKLIKNMYYDIDIMIMYNVNSATGVG